MRVILFGATGMVGQAALRACLRDDGVKQVLTVGRRPAGEQHEKLEDLVHQDLFDLSPIRGRLSGFDACLFCLGTSAAGMSEDGYRRVTYDLTLNVATELLKANPGMTFIYVSGTGTDSSERGSVMWARVKGTTENALLALPFKAAYMFRPGYIQPEDGVASSTRWLRVLYALVAPLYPLWKTLFPGMVTTSGRLSRVMLEVAEHGAAKRVLENRDVNALYEASTSVRAPGTAKAL